MNAKYQIEKFEEYSQLQEEINKKERRIKQLSRFRIIRKIFARDIEILSLKIMILHLHIDQMGVGIKGLIDAEGGDPKTLEGSSKQ